MTPAVVVHLFCSYSYDVTLTGILFGRSKIFIRFPQTLFTTEDAFQAKKPALGMLHSQLRKYFITVTNLMGTSYYCQNLQFC